MVNVVKDKHKVLDILIQGVFSPSFFRKVCLEKVKSSNQCYPVKDYNSSYVVQLIK